MSLWKYPILIKSFQKNALNFIKRGKTNFATTEQPAFVYFPSNKIESWNDQDQEAF
jgi:hypothetical protein